jgi:2-amino-4,5-dihydroxy-6-oxo-7-(phosphonooxy)heptanoate synthase
VVTHISFARSLRLERLSRNGSGLFIVPLDHAVTDGPILAGELDELVGEIVGNGADGVVLHKGAARHVRPQWFVDVALIVHLSASTALAPDPDAKYLVASVEEAVRLGADAVSVHVNLGSAGEREQLADLGAVADACDRWNVPLLAMMYVRGPRITNPRDPALIAHAVCVAAELGADLVKAPYPGSDAALADMVRGAAVPVLIAGGPPRDTAGEVLAHVRAVMRAGAGGVAMGRNIFLSPQPGAMTRKVADIVHGEAGHADIAHADIAHADIAHADIAHADIAHAEEETR